MLAKIVGSVLLALVVLTGGVRPGLAEIAPPGRFIEKPSHPFMPQPYGQFRTRLGWLLASMIRYENLYFWEMNPLTKANPGLYANAVRSEVASYGRLGPAAQYRYTEELIRDLQRMKIVALDQDRLSLALSTVPAAILADAAAMGIMAGIKFNQPLPGRNFLSLDSRYLEPGTEQNVIARYAFYDLELRYRDFMERAELLRIKAEIARGVSAAELRDLMSESVISAAIGATIKSFEQSPETLIDVFRKQKTKDLAAFGCACALDAKTHRPPNAWVHVLGPTDTYLTRLGYLMSYKITPPATTPINVLAGGPVDDLLARELAALRSMRREQPERYTTYLRSFLVDTDTLEAAMLKSLQQGAAAELIESTAINALFGAFALGGGGTAQVLTMLANAGYGALDAYGDMSDELRIRVQMAAFRGHIMNVLRPHWQSCGCGEGVGIKPDRVVKGKPPGDD